MDGEDGEAPVVLDLKCVTHESREGVRLLRHLVERGARLVSCPEYVREWVSREQD